MIISKSIRGILKEEIDDRFKEDSIINIVKSTVYLISIMVIGLIGYSPNIIKMFVSNDNMLISFLEYINNLVDSNNLLRIIFYFIIILLFLYNGYRIVRVIKRMNRKVHIFTLFSLNKTQFICDKKLSKKHEIETHNLVLSEDIKSINKLEDINGIVVIQDREIENFCKEKINNDAIYGFAGIAHTPLIFRAGYKIGDETYFNLFHKFRTEDEFRYLSKIEDGSKYERLVITERTLNKSSDELIVILETTFEIKTHELNIFNPEKKNTLRFTLSNKGFDVISNRTQIDEYVKLINTEMRELVKENNIKIVHMILCTSAAMTFALGMSMSNHYDARTIVYQYEKDYPWGIDVFNDSRDSIVITKDNT